jgi:hypothetical protein
VLLLVGFLFLLNGDVVGNEVAFVRCPLCSLVSILSRPQLHQVIQLVLAVVDWVSIER